MSYGEQKINVDSNEFNDREGHYKRLFNPADVSNWIHDPPDTFLPMIVHELVREVQIIKTWANLAEENPENGMKIIHPRPIQDFAKQLIQTANQITQIALTSTNCARAWRSEESKPKTLRSPKPISVYLAKANFDPEDVSEWLVFRPIEFILIFADAVRQQVRIILELILSIRLHKSTRIVAQIPEHGLIREMNLQEFINIVSTSANIINVTIDTATAYSKELKNREDEEKDQNSND